MTDADQSYRLFRMNALTGDIIRIDEVSAWSDDDAIAKALEAAGDQRIELWRDGRKLAAISGRFGPPELHIAPAGD
ncbi:hypothetical protein [Sphingomonas oryzagri]